MSDAPENINAKRLLLTVLLWVAGAVIFVACASALVISVSPAVGRHTWWSAWVAALAVGFSAAFVSLAALGPALFGGMQATVYGYLGGSVLRTLATLGGCMAAIIIFHAPAVATLVLASAMYLAQLIAEVAVLATALRKQKIA